MGYRLIQAVFPVSIPIYYDLGNIQYQIKRYKEMTVRDHIEFKLIVSTFLVPDFAIGGWNREGWVVFQLLLFQNACEQYLSDGELHPSSLSLAFACLWLQRYSLVSFSLDCFHADFIKEFWGWDFSGISPMHPMSP